MNATFVYGIFGALVFGAVMVAVVVWLFWLLVIGVAFALLYVACAVAVDAWRSRRQARTQVRVP